MKFIIWNSYRVDAHILEMRIFFKLFFIHVPTTFGFIWPAEAIISAQIQDVGQRSK